MKESLEQVLEEYKNFIRSKAAVYFILGSDEQDIIQEGMIGLVKAYNTFEEGKGANFRTYAGLCIDRQILSAIKTANRKKNIPLNGSVEIPETHAAGPSANPEDAAIYGDFMRTLSENRGGIFSENEHLVLLKLLEYKTPSQIAKELGKTVKQVENTCQRIKNKTKKYFDSIA